MKKAFILAALCVLPILGAEAQEKTERLDSVVVSASRAGKNTPVSFDNVGKDALERSNPMSSLPMALNSLPSVVTYNEGGTGLGASSMTIRGSKGSQINVTLNGITLNDAESQEVFWMNIPSLTSLISSVQVQRGLGTSAAGAGAFGASINMNTAFVSADPWADVSFSAGSYNTFVTTLAASTGLMPKGLYASAAYSYNTTEGYIRNAFVRSQSAFVALGWLGRKNSLRLTYLMGKQRSGITWDGIDLETYEANRRYNGAGEYYDDFGNVYYYPNAADNYAQHHLQLQYTHAFSDRLTLSATANYTRGDGYDEYYKVNRKLKNFGLPADIDPARSDMTYRKAMDNDNFVGQATLRYSGEKLNLTGGVNFSAYDGGHWGELLWIKKLPEYQGLSSVEWYNSIGRKLDASAFARAEYAPVEWLTAYADLQLRAIRYRLNGKDDDWIEYGSSPADIFDYDRNWLFFNPRAGITASLGKHKLFASVAIGNREPGRSDIKENIKGDALEIRPETMIDTELGWRFSAENFETSVDLYSMGYRNMLLETGRLSSSGYALKENIHCNAWRRGIEMQAAWKPWQWFLADGNLTLSRNIISDYTAFVPYEDYSGRTKEVHYGKTAMLLSPSVVGMLRLSFFPCRDAVVAIDTKYVGKQFIDNTMREELAIPAYGVVNLSAEKKFRLGAGYLTVSAYVNNLLNKLYYASGWRWESYSADDDRIFTGVGIYPQAERNLMVKVRFSF